MIGGMILRGENVVLGGKLVEVLLSVAQCHIDWTHRDDRERERERERKKGRERHATK